MLPAGARPGPAGGVLWTWTAGSHRAPSSKPFVGEMLDQNFVRRHLRLGILDPIINPLQLRLDRFFGLGGNVIANRKLFDEPLEPSAECSLN